jgi:ABC-2 type transport system ATP-binding protein
VDHNLTESIAAQETVLAVSGLTKHYGARTVVNNLDFAVQQGEVFGFLGPNGAGKTTTIAMILGLVRPDRGQITVLGHPIPDQQERALGKVGAMVETPAFYPYLTGLDNLRVIGLTRGNIPERRYHEALVEVGLGGRERDKLNGYSLGMKQRLAVAATLLHEPELLILDEPSNGLDPAGMVEMRRLILSLAERGHTIVLCSHMLGEVQQVCDRVMIMAQGKVISQGAVEDLLRRGETTVLRVDDPSRAERLVGDIPWIERIDRDGETLLLGMAAERSFDLGRTLIDHGLIIGELRQSDQNLERIFLEMTAPQATAAD